MLQVNGKRKGKNKAKKLKARKQKLDIGEVFQAVAATLQSSKVVTDVFLWYFSRKYKPVPASICQMIS